MRASLLMIALVLALPLRGQAPQAVPQAVLENRGQPMRISFHCTAEDMRAHGLACPADAPCPVYIELAGVEFVGGKIFVAGNLHTQDSTLSSILLASGDEGKTWNEPHERIPSAALDQVQFVDLADGWVGGQYLLGVPRDPFLLLTTDGGQSWRARPIYRESAVGSIDRFWFESKTRGNIWIDRSKAGEPGRRYEMYESMTGGESWMVRGVSDQPIRSQEPRTTSDWRLRADAATQSYRVEKRVGESWQPVAAFQIRVGECREPEVVLAEPPPPEPPNPEQTAPAAPPAPKPAKPPSLRRPPQ